MTEAVQKILNQYPAENPGTKASLARILNHGRLAGTGKVVILPVDQGFEHGPARSFAVNPPGYDPYYHVELAIDAGCNAYAAPYGSIQAIADRYAADLPLILKVNNHDSLTGEVDPIPAVTSSVVEALQLGCVGVGFTIYPGSSLRLMQPFDRRAFMASTPPQTPKPNIRKAVAKARHTAAQTRGFFSLTLPIQISPCLSDRWTIETGCSWQWRRFVSGWAMGALIHRQLKFKLFFGERDPH